MNIFTWSEPQLLSFFFVLVRVTSLMIFLPIFGEKAVPQPVKILFGLSFAFVAYPMLLGQGTATVPAAVFESTSRTAWAVSAEVLFGAMIGFAARWIFDAVQFAGHFAGTTIGFSMASVMDPHTETQTIAFAELQYILVALLFLGMDGHHLYLKAILDSFRIVPLSGVDFTAHGSAITDYLIKMTSEVIVLGLKLSAPVLVVGFIINLTFGVLTRAVPNLNVMTVSFTANIVIGVLVVLVSLPGFVNMVTGAFDSYTPELSRFMGLFHG